VSFEDDAAKVPSKGSVIELDPRQSCRVRSCYECRLACAIKQNENFIYETNIMKTILSIIALTVMGTLSSCSTASGGMSCCKSGASACATCCKDKCVECCKGAEACKTCCAKK